MHTASKVTPRGQPTAIPAFVPEKPTRFLTGVDAHTCDCSKGRFSCL